jgi:hypothetical protein
MLAIMILEGSSSQGSQVDGVGGAERSPGQATLVRLLMQEADEGCASSLEGRGLVLRIFTEVPCLLGYHACKQIS